MSKTTALYQQHLDAGGKLVNFAGYSLPINYGSQIEEHHAVRKAAGMFDVSHMVITDIKGSGAKGFLQYLLANDVAKLTTSGKALYSCMLNPKGGVVDDLVVYWLGEDYYRIVSNSATREVDLAWFKSMSDGFSVTITERSELAILAVQGSKAIDLALAALPETVKTKAAALGRFFGVVAGGWFVSRTGYTGEDGFEIVTTGAEINKLWQDLLDLGVKPCGLGARDSLRLEAGMMLYGADMTVDTTPLESGLRWTLAMQDSRDFIGKEALQKHLDNGVERKMVGLTLDGKGIIRAGQKVLAAGEIIGEVTSGGYSPSLGKSIGFARVEAKANDSCEVQIRNRLIPAKIGSLIFLKNT